MVHLEVSSQHYHSCTFPIWVKGTNSFFNKKSQQNRSEVNSVNGKGEKAVTNTKCHISTQTQHVNLTTWLYNMSSRLSDV